MKKISFSLCFILGIFTSYAQDRCDTLKWKTLETYYAKVHEGTYYKFNDSVTINMDTLSVFYPGIYYTNVSNDTFYKNTSITFCVGLKLCADTGTIVSFFDYTTYPFPSNCLPEDALNAAIGLRVDFNDIVSIVEGKNMTIEDIAYCHLLVGVLHTSRDGQYSDSVVYAGMDTTLFYITKTPPPSIRETTQAEISVFPNPAQSQFTVTNTENANLTLYNVLGQEVRQVIGEGESTIIQTEGLPQGIYILKVEKEGAVLTKKVQIVN